MNFRSPLFPVALFLSLFTQGCGTVFTHSMPDPATSAATGVYRGTQTDVLAVRFFEGFGTHLYTRPGGWGLMLAGVIVACDIPLSAVADTFMWPYDRTTPATEDQPGASE